MKIIRLRTQVVHLPIDPPIQTLDHGRTAQTDCVLTFLDTDNGLTGEGLVMTINNRRLGVIHEMIRNLGDLVIGLDPRLGGSLNARAWKELNFLGYEGVSIIGLAALDIALWDLRGKAAGLNVAHLIGACRAAVPAYASGGSVARRQPGRPAKPGARLRRPRFPRHEDPRRSRRSQRHGRPRPRGARGDRSRHRPDGGCQPANDRQTGHPYRPHDGGPQPDLVRGTDHLPRPRGRGADRRRARHPDRIRRNGLHPSRHPRHAAGTFRRRADAGPATDGRPDRVPQGRPSVRGLPHPLRVPPVPGNEPVAARGAARRLLPGTHAVV